MIFLKMVIAISTSLDKAAVYLAPCIELGEQSILKIEYRLGEQKYITAINLIQMQKIM